MFGVDTSEFLLIAVIALVFIGPKDLPRVMRTIGRWVGKVRGMARHFTSGIEAMVRESELEEMEKQWREENERIVREFPANPEQLMMPSANPPPADDQASLPLGEPDDIPPEERPLP
jgi:sec-independent protein translocase protein TatB